MSQDSMSGVMKKLPVFACALALAGCVSPFGQDGYFRDKSGDYTQARASAPLDIPEQINALPMGEALAIPAIGSGSSELSPEFVVPRPDQSLSRKEGGVFTIEREGDNQWLLVSLSPAETWPVVLEFLEQNLIDVDVQNVKQGYIETQWSDLGKDKSSGFVMRTLGNLVGAEVSGPIEDRFLIEVKQGVQPQTAEVYIKHKARPLSEGSQVADVAEWDNLSERSQQMDDAVLNDLMLFLTEEGSEKSDSYLAQDLNLGSLAVVQKDGAGNPELIIETLSYARSWSVVDAALEKAKVEVTDRNRSAGLFYIQMNAKGAVVKNEADSGWFSGWFSSDKDKAKAKAKAGADKDPLLMRLSELNGMVRVSVERDINTSAPVDVSTKLLNLVKENL